MNRPILLGAVFFSTKASTHSEPPAVLTSGNTIHTPLAHNYHRFTQSAPYWTSVGVRTAAGDYDVAVWGATTSSWPSCFTDIKAGSGGIGVVDFVIGDFNYNPSGTYYAGVYDYSIAGGADIEWDSGTDLLSVNAVSVSRTSDASDVLEVWDVFLSTGQTYDFAFHPSGPNLHLLLFRNTISGVYWSGRGGAQFDVADCRTYTAPTSGYYGVVVVNETGAASSYTLGVSQAPCPCAAALSPEVPTSVPSPDGYFSFTQLPNFWAVVATRGVTSADDWDLQIAGSATGGSTPTCVGNVLASSSYGAGLVDIGVIDFDTTPLGIYFARSHHFSGGAPNGLIEWDWTHGELFANGYTESRSMPSNDLAHSWDAYMEAGRTYQLIYTPSDLTIKLLVFENPGGGTYAVTRSAAVLTTSSTISYTPTVTGYHGFVIVNDQAVNGSYSIGYGTCSAIALVSDVAVTAPSQLNSFTFVQPSNQWGAVGVRTTTADWDIRVSGTSSSPFPNCVGPSLASSASGALNYVDFVTGDFFHDPPGTYYVESYQFAGPPLVASPVEWSAGNDGAIVNDAPMGGFTGANDVLRSWSVHLETGVTYTFEILQAGTASLHLMLFRNPGGGVYWAPRSAAVLDVTPGALPLNYVAPSSGEYGVVVVNDDGADDSYVWTVKACFAPTPLASGITVTENPEGFHSFTQAVNGWTAVGVRSTSDWDIVVNLNPGGGAPGLCQTGPLGNSEGVPPDADFVVGDFNVGGNVLGTFYVRPYKYSGDQPGTVEWDSGADQITVGAPPIHRTTNASDVLEIWDVFLVNGQTYGIFFARTGAHTQVLLFQNPGGAYWAGRGGSVLASATSASYTAPATGWYGVVVVNDDGAAGTYDLGIYNTPLAVESGVPAATALRSVQPNPARAQMSIEYTLHERAPVRLQLLDLAGRVVANVENGERGPGVWHSDWNGRMGSGAKAPPGIYLVRLEVDGRAIGQRKITVLE